MSCWSLCQGAGFFFPDNLKLLLIFSFSFSVGLYYVFSLLSYIYIYFSSRWFRNRRKNVTRSGNDTFLCSWGFRPLLCKTFLMRLCSAHRGRNVKARQQRFTGSRPPRNLPLCTHTRTRAHAHTHTHSNVLPRWVHFASRGQTHYSSLTLCKHFSEFFFFFQVTVIQDRFSSI